MSALKSDLETIRRARSEMWLRLTDQGYTSPMLAIVFGVSLRTVVYGLAQARAARQTVRAKLGTDLADIVAEYGDDPEVAQWLKSTAATRN